MSCGCKCSYCASCNSTTKHTISKVGSKYVIADKPNTPRPKTPEPESLYTKNQAD